MIAKAYSDETSGRGSRGKVRDQSDILDQQVGGRRKLVGCAINGTKLAAKRLGRGGHRGMTRWAFTTSLKLANAKYAVHGVNLPCCGHQKGRHVTAHEPREGIVDVHADAHALALGHQQRYASRYPLYLAPPGGVTPSGRPHSCSPQWRYALLLPRQWRKLDFHVADLT